MNLEPLKEYAVIGGMLFASVGVVLVLLIVCIKKLTKPRARQVAAAKESPMTQPEEVVVVPDNTPQDNILQDNTPQDNTPQDSTSQDEMSQDNTLQDNTPQTVAPATQEQPERIVFAKVNGTEPVQQETFEVKDVLKVGRREGVNDWVIQDDDTVSSKHCQVYRKDDGLYVRDMDSTNGVYLNGQKIIQDTKLTQNDTIQIGQTQYHITFNCL